MTHASNLSAVMFPWTLYAVVPGYFLQSQVTEVFTEENVTVRLVSQPKGNLRVAGLISRQPTDVTLNSFR